MVTMGMEMPMERGRFLWPNRIMHALVPGSHPHLYSLDSHTNPGVVPPVHFPTSFAFEVACSSAFVLQSSELKGHHQGKGISHLEKRLSRKRINGSMSQHNSTGNGFSGFFSYPKPLGVTIPSQDCQHWEICIEVEKSKRKFWRHIVKSKSPENKALIGKNNVCIYISNLGTRSIPRPYSIWEPCMPS